MSGWDLFTLMILLRRGAAFTESRRTVSVSWPPPGRMTPLRRPRDALGGMQSGAPSLHSPSPYPSRSDMSTRSRTQFDTPREGKLINSSNLTRIKFDSDVRWCHLKEKLVLAFPKRQPCSSSPAAPPHWRKTNHSSLVNCEQIATVTEQQAALTSGYESELTSTVHSRSTKRLTVEIRASHAGTVSTWMDAGLVRSPDARNKSWPFPVLLVLEAVKAQFAREKHVEPPCVTNKRWKQGGVGENNVWKQSGAGYRAARNPAPFCPQHIDVQVQKGATSRCGRRQVKRSDQLPLRSAPGWLDGAATVVSVLLRATTGDFWRE